MNSTAAPIDRQKVVQRHNVVMRSIDDRSPLTVGNGEFAFGVDPTGLQSFPEPYYAGAPLCTMSNWGWHSKPMPEGLDPAKLRYTNFDTYGRPVGHATSAEGQKPLFDWLRENPHRFHLGRIGLEITMSDGRLWTVDDLRDIEQTLDVWTGIITSRFKVEGESVEVITCCGGEWEVIGVQIRSTLLKSNRLKVLVHFPYGSQDMSAAEWDKPDLHSTKLSRIDKGAVFNREMDDIKYEVILQADKSIECTERAKHEFLVGVVDSDHVAFTADFSRQLNVDPISFDQAIIASKDFWRDFWLSGGAIDFEGSTDPRASELERRVILSEYVLRINSSGSLPAAETGLTCNSWYGKFHLEMHWWHGVHHALWNRLPLLEKSLGYYHHVLPVARDIAKRQGYTGARWPKMVGPSGVDSPSPVGPLLIWQQPHPIYYAELVYREKPTAETLEKFRDIVLESAEFIADFAHHDATAGRYVLGPPLKTVSENTDPRTSRNGTFELTFWRFGLITALAWLERLGLPTNEKWSDVLENLSCASTQDGKYLLQEGMTDTFTKWNWEHPAVTGALGVLPGDEIDPAIMKTTVEHVMSVWQWDRCWGWDFPMVAMCAARSGRPDLAIDALFIKSIKNGYAPSGHNWQRPSLPLYLPGNGGLLSAIAMMAAGWENAPCATRECPGFPQEGWKVRYEGLKPIF